MGPPRPAPSDRHETDLPSGPFLAAIEQALRYGLFDLGRLEALILKQVAGDFFALDAGEDGDA